MTTTETKGRERIENIVRDIVANELDLDPETIGLEAALMEDLGADSMNLVGIGLAVEERFAIPLRKDLLAQVRSVGDIVWYVEQAHGPGATG